MEELTGENSFELERRYRTTSFVVLAQIAFTLILVAAAFFVVPERENQISQQTLTALWTAIIFVAVAALVLRRMFFRWDRLKDAALLKGFGGLIKTLQTNAIILGALAEATVLIGFVIVVLSGAKYEIVRAEIVALIVFAINFPCRAVWRKIAAGLQEV